MSKNLLKLNSSSKNRLKTLLFLSIFFLLQNGLAIAQSNKADSLKTVLSQAQNDSNKVTTLLALSKLYFETDPNLSIKYAGDAQKLAESLLYYKGVALGYKNVGIGYYMQSDYFNAIQNWNASLRAYIKINDKTGEANILSNLGAVYFNQADDIKALDYYIKALKLAEETNDSLRLATVLMNIGGVYHNKKATNDKALEYFLRALPISDAINDKDAIGTVSVNIGEIYFETGQYDKALEYLQKSIFAYEGAEDVAYSYITIGKVYSKQKEYDVAILNQNKALTIAKEFDSKLDIARSLLSLGNTYQQKGDYNMAIKNYLEGIAVAIAIKANIELRGLYQGISESYGSIKNFNKAFEYQGLLLNIKDTLYNNETDKKLGTLMFNYEIDKKENKISLLTKDTKIQQQTIQRQKMIKNTFIVGFMIVIVFAGIFFRQRNKITKEKNRSEELLLNILPAETAEELKNTGAAKAKSFEHVTVLFTDFKDFTKLAEILTAQELVAEINECFSAFDLIMEKYGVEKIKTIGDAYMAVGGLPTPNDTNATDVVNAALAIRDFMLDHQKKKEAAGIPSFRIRIGVHTGPVVAGIVGIKKFAYDIWGDTVNTSSRMESSGEPGKVNISGTTYELVKHQFRCTHRGKLEAKNKGALDMYFVEGHYM
jgi:tetratricopeptide (TPR) repeat protein